MLEIVLLVVGVLLGIWWWSVIILPLFYGIPKAFYYVLKGLLRKSAILFYLSSFILWNLFFIVIAVILVMFFPQAVNTLRNSGTFGIGQIIGVAISVINMFTKGGLRSLNDDFWDVMIIRRYWKTSDLLSQNNLAEILRNNFSEKYGDQAEEKLMEYLDSLGRQ